MLLRERTQSYPSLGSRLTLTLTGPNLISIFKLANSKEIVILGERHWNKQARCFLPNQNRIGSYLRWLGYSSAVPFSLFVEEKPVSENTSLPVKEEGLYDVLNAFRGCTANTMSDVCLSRYPRVRLYPIDIRNQISTRHDRDCFIGRGYDCDDLPFAEEQQRLLDMLFKKDYRAELNFADLLKNLPQLVQHRIFLQQQESDSQLARVVMDMKVPDPVLDENEMNMLYHRHLVGLRYRVFAKLLHTMDEYTFLRMFQPDAGNYAIFYGGAAHAQNISRMIEEIFTEKPVFTEHGFEHCIKIRITPELGNLFFFAPL